MYEGRIYFIYLSVVQEERVVSGWSHRITEWLISVVGRVQLSQSVSKGGPLKRGRGTVAVQRLESNGSLDIPWSRVGPGGIWLSCKPLTNKQCILNRLILCFMSIKKR